MNTAPMTPTPDTWHEMSEPKTFPVLVQYSDDTYEILYGSFIMPGKHAIRWQQFVAPPAPKPDAFEQWYASTPAGTGFSSCWKAAESYGRADERSRFAEGVERIVKRHEQEHGYYFSNLVSDLRALAKGTP